MLRMANFTKVGSAVFVESFSGEAGEGLIEGSIVGSKDSEGEELAGVIKNAFIWNEGNSVIRKFCCRTH